MRESQTELTIMPRGLALPRLSRHRRKTDRQAGRQAGRQMGRQAETGQVRDR